MIFFDIETTGLITNEALPLSSQPRIIEIGAVKTDNAGNERDSLSFFVNPGVKLFPEITKITGIRDEDLAGAPHFAQFYPSLCHFFLGEEMLIAHNVRFDLMMLVFELRRIDKQWAFPFCRYPTDSRMRWNGKLMDWAFAVKGPDYVQKHRALEDARLLRDCWFSGKTKE